MDEDKLRKTLLYILDLLVHGQYEALASSSVGRLTADMLRQAAQEWPYPLIMPHSTALSDLIYSQGEINGLHPRQWWLDVNLWTAEEGRSDLTLSITLTDIPGEFYQVELDNLHVL